MEDTATIQAEDERQDPNEWLDHISCDLGLRRILDEQIAIDNLDFKRSANPSWYPSDLGKDLYTRYIKRKGYDALALSQRTLRKFEIGKLWEARLHRVIDAKIARGDPGILEIDLNPDAEIEAFKKRVENNELGLRGFYDRMLLVNDPSRGWIIVVYEIKSVASRTFHYQRKLGEQPRGNRMQLMFYLERILQQDNWSKLVAWCREKHGISPAGAVGVLSQVSKDDGSMWERTYEFDPALYGEIVGEIEALNGYWERGELPPKPPLIIIEGGSARVNWEVTFSPYVHHILGPGYVGVIEAAERLVRQHAYQKKKALLTAGRSAGIAKVEAEMEHLNGLCRG